MAGGSIKGITITFEGDTTRLDRALREVNNKTKSIDKELRQVDKALKFNPKNVDLLRQKQTLLNQKITETKNKLDVLKQQQAQMDAQGIDENSEDYRKLQREIIATESKLKTFESQQKKVNNAINGMSMQNISEQFKRLGDGLTKAGNAMKPVSAAAGALVAGLGAVSVKAGIAADDLNTLSKVTGIGTGELQKYSYAADLVDVSTEDIAKANQKLKKSAYAASEGSKTQAEAFEKIGVSVTNADGSLRDSEEIFQDVITNLGKMTNETERDAIAQQLMGKSAANLNPLIADGGETYKMVADTLKKYNLEYVDQETLDKANEFNDSLDTMKLIGSVALAQVGSQLAGYLAPALEKVVDVVGRFAEWLGNLNPKVLAIVGVIAAVVAGIAPVLLILGKLAFAISSITGLMGTLGLSFGAIAGPVGIAIAAIAAIIAIGVLLYKNWDTIKAKAIEIKDAVVAKWNELKTGVINIYNGIKTAIANAWNSMKTKAVTTVTSIKTGVINAFNTLKSTVSTIWNNIKTAITRPIESAKNTVVRAVSRLKSLFPLHIGKIFSGLKVPHFHISGGKAPFGIGGKGTKPSISVDWYKRAMDNPYMFSTPTFFGAGEAGDEMLYGRAALMRDISEAVSRGGGNGNAPSIVININGASADPREIAEEVKRTLIRETNQRRLAWQ